jgi:hypothetical protein
MEAPTITTTSTLCELRGVSQEFKQPAGGRRSWWSRT